jgi:hypothetical protein
MIHSSKRDHTIQEHRMIHSSKRVVATFVVVVLAILVFAFSSPAGAQPEGQVKGKEAPPAAPHAAALDFDWVDILPGQGGGTTPPDTTPPDTSITSGPSGTVNSNSATFQYTSTENQSTFRCKLDSQTIQDCNIAPNTQLQKLYAGLSDGSHTFSVWAVDPAGNIDPDPAVAIWTVDTSTPGVACPSGATNITPSNFISAINTGGTAGEDFCVQDGTYNVTTPLQTEDSQTFTGIYTDGSRPQFTGNNVQTVFNISNDQNVEMTEIAISGATRAGGTGCPYSYGRGIQGSGSSDNLTLRSVRVYDNANSGIGGIGNGTEVYNSILEDNGYDSLFWSDCTTSAGIKAIGTLTIEQSVVRNNGFNGIWKDNPNPGCHTDCAAADRQPGPFIARDNIVTGNGKIGVDYEITESPTTASLVADNTIQGNAWNPATGGRRAELLILSSEDIEVTRNTFGDADPNPNGVNDGNVTNVGVLVVDEPVGGNNRTWNLSNDTNMDERTIWIHGNTRNGDVLTCSGSGTGELEPPLGPTGEGCS